LPAIETYVRVPVFVTPDGNGLVYSRISLNTPPEDSLRVLSLNDDRVDQPLPLHFPTNAAISPDGRWLAYISEETGDYEVYVQPYPNPAGSKWKITSSGGRDPVWSRDGRELFYQRDTTTFAVRITTEGSFSAEPAVALFDGPYLDASGRYYDVAPHGRFLMIKAGWLSAGREAPLHVVLNWCAELERLVPADNWPFPSILAPSSASKRENSSKAKSRSKRARPPAGAGSIRQNTSASSDRDEPRCGGARDGEGVGYLHRRK